MQKAMAGFSPTTYARWGNCRKVNVTMSDDYAIGYKGQRIPIGARIHHHTKHREGRLVLLYWGGKRGVVPWDISDADSALWTIDLEYINLGGATMGNPGVNSPPSLSDYAVGYNGLLVFYDYVTV